MVREYRRDLTETIFIVSLKFAPGLYKEFSLIGSIMETEGKSVEYFVSEQYKQVVNDARHERINYITNSVNLKQVAYESFSFLFAKLGKWKNRVMTTRPAAVYFYNLHPLNLVLARIARKYVPSTKIFYHLHEPYQPDKCFFSLKQKIVVLLQEALQHKLVMASDVVVVPSPYAQELFRTYFKKFAKKCYTVPLCIEDRPANTTQRSGILMTGHMYPDGRVEDFCRVLEYAANRNSSIAFRIVTSSRIRAFLERRLSGKALCMVEVIEKENLSDEEINNFMANSIACLSMHTRGSQSGVTPVAFMNGTPIIARDIPMFRQYIKDKSNGRLVDPNADPSEWIVAIEDVMKNFALMSQEARKTFMTIFDGRHGERYFKWLLNEIG